MLVIQVLGLVGGGIFIVMPVYVSEMAEDKYFNFHLWNDNVHFLNMRFEFNLFNSESAAL